MNTSRNVPGVSSPVDTGPGSVMRPVPRLPKTRSGGASSNSFLRCSSGLRLTMALTCVPIWGGSCRSSSIKKKHASLPPSSIPGSPSFCRPLASVFIPKGVPEGPVGVPRRIESRCPPISMVPAFPSIFKPSARTKSKPMMTWYGRLRHTYDQCSLASPAISNFNLAMNSMSIT